MDKKKWQQAVDERGRLLNDIPQEFLTNLDKVQADLFNQLQQAVKEMDTKGALLEKNAFNIRLANRMHANLREWLRDAGYYSSVSDFGKNYNSVIKNANAYFGSLDLADSFLQRDLDNLSQIRKDDLNFLKTRDEAVIRETYDAVINSIYKQEDWRSLQGKLKALHVDNDINRGLLKKYAGTYANTAFAAFDRRAIQIQSERFNLDLFLFAGSSLKDSREFCRDRVNKIFKKEEVDAWQGQPWKGKRAGGSVWVYLGGYNCTHHLAPVTEELAKELGYEL